MTPIDDDISGGADAGGCMPLLSVPIDIDMADGIENSFIFHLFWLLFNEVWPCLGLALFLLLLFDVQFSALYCIVKFY